MGRSARRRAAGGLPGGVAPRRRAPADLPPDGWKIPAVVAGEVRLAPGAEGDPAACRRSSNPPLPVHGSATHLRPVPPAGDATVHRGLRAVGPARRADLPTRGWRYSTGGGVLAPHPGDEAGRARVRTGTGPAPAFKRADAPRASLCGDAALGQPPRSGRGRWSGGEQRMKRQGYYCAIGRTQRKLAFSGRRR